MVEIPERLSIDTVVAGFIELMPFNESCTIITGEDVFLMVMSIALIMKKLILLNRGIF